MKINFNQSLQNLDGSPLEIVTGACMACGRPSESRPATLRGMCSDALVQAHRDTRGQPIEVPGEEAAKRYALAIQIVNEDVLELEPEDVTLIRSLVLKRYPSPLFSAQARAMLDQKEEKG